MSDLIPWIITIGTLVLSGGASYYTRKASKNDIYANATETLLNASGGLVKDLREQIRLQSMRIESLSDRVNALIGALRDAGLAIPPRKGEQ